MHRSFFAFILTGFILTISSSNAAECPNGLPPGCSCSDYPANGRLLECEKLTASTDLKALFDDITQSAGDNPIFEGISLMYNADNGSVTIPSNVMTGLKANEISFWLSYDNEIASIAEDAFPSTYDYTTTLHFVWAKVTDSPNLFQFVRKFRNLRNFEFEFGEIFKIDDFAFAGLRYLEDIYLSQTQVTEIGIKPFADLPILSRVYLYNNHLSANGFSNEAFHGINPYVEVNLVQNDNLTSFPENVFKTLLDTTAPSTKVILGSDYYYETDHLECDERAEWICNKDVDYQSKVIGFNCTGSKYKDVSEYCAAGCPTSSLFPSECSCSRTDLRQVQCFVNATTDFKVMFDRIAEAAVTNPVFDTLDLQFSKGEAKVTIPPNVMTGLQFSSIQIFASDNVIEINTEAFSSTQQYTTALGFDHAYFHTHNDPFRVIRDFQNLEHISFTGCEIPEIPSFAFDGLQSLESISFTENQVNAIGIMPFSFSQDLTILNLMANGLTDNSLSAGCFEDINPSAAVDLSGNTNLTHLNEDVFKILLDSTVSVVSVGPEENNGSNHLVCDQKSNWICENASNYEPKLKGFYCMEDSYYDIFEYCEKSSILLKTFS